MNNQQTLLKAIQSEGNSFDFTPYLRAYQVEYADIDASTQTCASGKTVRDFLRTKRTIKCTLRTTTIEEMNAIMAVAKQKALSVAFYDMENGTYSEQTDKLLEVYPSATRTASVYSTADGVTCQEFALDFIEF